MGGNAVNLRYEAKNKHVTITVSIYDAPPLMSSWCNIPRRWNVEVHDLTEPYQFTYLSRWKSVLRRKDPVANIDGHVQRAIHYPLSSLNYARIRVYRVPCQLRSGTPPNLSKSVIIPIGASSVFPSTLTMFFSPLFFSLQKTRETDVRGMWEKIPFVGT